jgi:hypothetical protein
MAKQLAAKASWEATKPVSKSTSNANSARRTSTSGHANVSVSRAYGRAEGYPLGEFATAIKRIRFAGLKLARRQEALSEA